MNVSCQEFDSLPKVNIIGTGVRGKKQITLESINLIKNSAFILYFPIEKNLYKWLTEILRVKNAESLSGIYKHGDVDHHNYNRIVDRVLEVSKEYGEVSLLVPGHPYLGVSWIRRLNKMAKENLIELNVLEGISSFDTMISDLKVDPLDHGSTIVDANRLLLFQLKIETKIDLYIYHICSVGNSRTDYNDLSKNNHLERLQNYLCNFYYTEHEIILISSNINSSRSLIKKCKLKDLISLGAYITVASSLFIPGINTPKEDIDKDFYEIMKSTVLKQ